MVEQIRSSQERCLWRLALRPAMALVSGVIFAVQSSAAVCQTVIAPKDDGETLRTRLASTMNPAGRSMPADATDLDSMFRKGDLAQLSKRLRATESGQAIILDMNWEQSKLYDGAGFIIAYAYMYDLWRLGTALPSPNGDGFKQSAAMIYLYSFDLITTDGPQCADASAPIHRRDQLFLQNQPIMKYLQALPRAFRMQVGSISLGVEAATAPVRMKDDVLCSGGLAEMKEGLNAQGTNPLQQIPGALSTYGRTYAIPDPPRYKPQFVDARIWRPKQTKARQALPELLTQMLSAPIDR